MQIKGTDWQITADVYGYRQGVGYTRTIEIQCFGKSVAISKLNELKAAGFDAEMSGKSGPKYIVTGRTPVLGDGTTEVPEDRWSWRTELVSRSIWRKPNVAIAVEVIGASFKSKLQDAISAGTAFGDIEDPPWDASGFEDIAQSVYAELVQGAEEYELECFVLTRRRMTSIGYASKTSMSAASIVYTTDQLITAARIPADIQLVLPATPSAANTPPQSMWGWRRRENEGDREASYRFGQVNTWVFAAWSTFLYTPA